MKKRDEAQERWKRRTLLAAACLTMGATACSPGAEEEPPGVIDIKDGPTMGKSDEAQPTPPDGQSSFVSADGYNGQQTQENTESDADSSQNGSPNAAPGAERDADRTVEEGDIYRVVNGATDLIFNLNRYRGFQIIDFSDPSTPDIVGRVKLNGTPVEMYQVGDRVYVLLNDWYSYWHGSSRFAPVPKRHHGGGVGRDRHLGQDQPHDRLTGARRRLGAHLSPDSRG